MFDEEFLIFKAVYFLFLVPNVSKVLLSVIIFFLILFYHLASRHNLQQDLSNPTGIKQNPGYSLRQACGTFDTNQFNTEATKSDLVKNKLHPHLNLTWVCGWHWPQPQSQTTTAGAGPSFSGRGGKKMKNKMRSVGFHEEPSLESELTSLLQQLSDVYPKAWSRMRFIWTLQLLKYATFCY